jgi:hypothetical protein
MLVVGLAALFGGAKASRTNQTAIPKFSYIFTADDQRNHGSIDDTADVPETTDSGVEVLGALQLNPSTCGGKPCAIWEKQHIGVTVDQEGSAYGYRVRSRNDMATLLSSLGLSNSFNETSYTLEAWFLLGHDYPNPEATAHPAQSLMGIARQGTTDAEKNAATLSDCAEGNVWLSANSEALFPWYTHPDTNVNCHEQFWGTGDFDLPQDFFADATSRIQFIRITYTTDNLRFTFEHQPQGICDYAANPAQSTGIDPLDVSSLLHFGLKHTVTGNPHVLGKDFSLLGFNFYAGERDVGIPTTCLRPTVAADSTFLDWLPNSAPACPDTASTVEEDACVAIELWFENATCSSAIQLDSETQTYIYDGATTCCPDACCDLDNYAIGVVPDFAGRSVAVIEFYVSGVSGLVSAYTDSSCTSSVTFDAPLSGSTIYVKTSENIFGDNIGEVLYYMSDGTDSGPVTTRAINSINTPDPPVANDVDEEVFASLCTPLTMSATDPDCGDDTSCGFTGYYSIISTPSPSEAAGTTVNSVTIYSSGACTSAVEISSFPHDLPVGQDQIWYEIFVTSDGSSDLVATDVIEFTAFDQDTGDESLATAFLNVDVNNVLSAVAATVEILEDTRTTILLDASDATNSSDFTFTVYVATLPSEGTLYYVDQTQAISISGAVGYVQLPSGTNEVDYVPPAQVIGNSYSSFEFYVTDSTGTKSANAVITIDILPIPDAPILELATSVVGDTMLELVIGGEPASLELVLTDPDEDRGGLIYRCRFEPQSGRTLAYHLPLGEQYADGTANMTDVHWSSALAGTSAQTFFGFTNNNAEFETNFDVLVSILSDVQVEAGVADPPGSDSLTITVWDTTNPDLVGTFVLTIDVAAAPDDVGSYDDLTFFESPIELILLWLVVGSIPICCCCYCFYTCYMKWKRRAVLKALGKNTDDLEDFKMTNIGPPKDAHLMQTNSRRSQDCHDEDDRL